MVVETTARGKEANIGQIPALASPLGWKHTVHGLLGPTHVESPPVAVCVSPCSTGIVIQQWPPRQEPLDIYFEGGGSGLEPAFS